MASRTSVGVVTLFDVQDGFNPISVLLGNQSHSFPADDAGFVDATPLSDFICSLQVYLGVTRLNYHSSNTKSCYRVKSVTGSETGWNPNTVFSAGGTQQSVVLDGIPTGTTNVKKAAFITVVIDVYNTIGNLTPVTLEISLNKAIQGAGGALVNMRPTRQTFEYDENDNVPTALQAKIDNGSFIDTISIDVRSTAETGGLTAQISENGGSFRNAAVGSGAGKISAIDVNKSGTDTIVFTRANFGTNNSVSIKVSGGTGGADVVSFGKIKNGSTGPAALLVVIKPSVEGFAFRNNTGANKTLIARIYDNNGGLELTSSNATIEYQWYQNDTIVPGATSDRIVVTPNMVPDDGSELWQCAVKVD